MRFTVLSQVRSLVVDSGVVLGTGLAAAVRSSWSGWRPRIAQRESAGNLDVSFEIRIEGSEDESASTDDASSEAAFEGVELSEVVVVADDDEMCPEKWSSDDETEGSTDSEDEFEDEILDLVTKSSVERVFGDPPPKGARHKGNLVTRIIRALFRWRPQ